MANVLVSELRRVPVSLDMILILRRALYVHVPRVPVALLGDTLWAPMRPNPKLRIPKPIRAMIGLERLPKRQEGPLRNLPLKKLRVTQRMSHASQREYGKSARQE